MQTYKVETKCDGCGKTVVQNVNPYFQTQEVVNQGRLVLAGMYAPDKHFCDSGCVRMFMNKDWAGGTPELTAGTVAAQPLLCDKSDGDGEQIRVQEE